MGAGSSWPWAWCGDGVRGKLTLTRAQRRGHSQCVRERDPCGQPMQTGRGGGAQEILEREIAKVRKAKAEHSGENGKSRRRVGFPVAA